MKPDISSIRHSLAHLLAKAVLELDPEAKLGTGPVTDNGFFYDFEFSEDTILTDRDFKKLEKIIRGFIRQNLGFERTEISLKEAEEIFRDQPYKLELAKDFTKEGQMLTIYKTGDFIDLCRGGHVEKTSEIDPDAFSITRIAGAYWKSDESREQLTRITGIAFETKDALEKYQVMLEEAKKRDHKKIGKELGLFVFSDLVGGGLPLFTPKGTIIRTLLDEYVWELRHQKDYERVTIPHITKKALYETSGHWSKFSEELFRVKTREGHEFAMKPMNCPHHAQIFASTPRSYRDLPVRYAETTMVYRDEQSGELSGLSRVLAITQDDAHVFCRESQVESEIFSIWDIIKKFYTTFGFELSLRFSRHDPEHFEKYLGTEETWKKAEAAIRSILDSKQMKYVDGPGEAAMYGPKIDFLAKDSIGRILQVATIQLDFNQPERFNLSCTNEHGEKESIVMIHCAIMGSLERFMATLIEHTAGAFPLWLSPVQVAILPIGESHHEYAKKLAVKLREKNFRIEIHSDESLGKRIRETKTQKIPYALVVGDKEVESETISVESRDHGKLGASSFADFLARVTKERESRE